MEFVNKAKIDNAAQEFNAARKAEALETMRNEIEQVLAEALKAAEETGNAFAYQDRKLTIPEFFKDVKGCFEVPDEIREGLWKAGFRVKHNYMEGRTYTLL
jgi:hypothetical protein